MGEYPARDLMLGIVTMLREHWDELDADFQRYYALDLGAVCFGPDHAGLRRIHALIVSLPPDSALARSMGWAWDDEREMTATLIELVHDQASSARAMVNALSGKRKWNGPPKPLRWPRPAVPTPRAPRPAPSETGPLDRAAIRQMLTRG